jgi:hypothetical protein
MSLAAEAPAEQTEALLVEAEGEGKGKRFPQDRPDRC